MHMIEEIKELGVKVASRDEAFFINVQRGLTNENVNLANQLKQVRASLKKTDREIVAKVRNGMKEDIKSINKSIELNNLFLAALASKLAQSK